MLHIDIDKVRLVDRVVSFKPIGSKKTQKITLRYKVMSVEDATNLLHSHDDNLSDEDSLAQSSVKSAKWMCDNLPEDHLKEWDVSFNGNDIAPLDADNFALVLSDGIRFHAIHNDFMDLVTTISEGKAKSVRDQEAKNLLRSAARLQR